MGELVQGRIAVAAIRGREKFEFVVRVNLIGRYYSGGGIACTWSNAVCVGIAPEIFDVIDDDYVVVRTAAVPTNKEALAER